MQSFWVGVAFLGILLGTHQELQASHAMGADLTYQCLGNNQYRVRLTVYRDCRGANLNSYQPILISSPSCGIPAYSVQANLVTFQEITPVCPAQQGLSTCIDPTFPLPGVEEYIYEALITLPQACRDWTFGWHICCRNYAITNSVVTTATRMYIEATLNNLDAPCNSSPTFSNKPVPYLCNGEPYEFNNGAVDPDGDSLVFELADPLDFQLGNTPTVPYQAGFNSSYPIATSPPNSFNFDPSSGQISFTPSGLQQAIVSILVKEYRNGILIGTTRRDLQIVVITCLNQNPIVNPPTNIQGGILTGNTFSVCAGSTLSFDIVGLDPDITNALSVNSTISTSLPGVNFTVTGSNPATASVSWPTTLSDTGSYFFTINFADNGCPFIGQQSVGFNIIVSRGEILPPQDILICPSTTDTMDLLATTPDNGGTYTWSPPTGIINTAGRTARIVLPQSKSATYQVTYEEAGACPILETINVQPEAEITLGVDSVSICAGDSAQLSANFQINGAPVPFSIVWDPQSTVFPANSPNPKASPASDQTYTVTATTLSCSYTAEVEVFVDNTPILDPLPNQTICSGDTLQLMASGLNLDNATFSWTPVLGLSDPSIQNPLAFPTTTRTYNVVASNQCGVDGSQVAITVRPPLSVNLAVDNIACNGANDGSILATTIGGGGNPQFSWAPTGSTTPSITNLAPGTYTVTVTDDANCTDSASATIVEPAPISASVNTLTNVTCNGGNNGEITVAVSGGTSPYEYSIDGSTFFNTPTFSNLGAGTYNITVRDANDCETVLGAVTIAQPPTPVVITATDTVNTFCTQPTGGFTVTASGGTGPYTFIVDTALQIVQNNGVFTGLQPGTYRVTVQDANGCEDFIDIPISIIGDPVAAIDSLQDASCFGVNDGAARVRISSGLPPYRIQLDGGSTGFTQDTFYQNLSPGYHVAQVLDNNACKYALVFFIDQPDSLFGGVGNQRDVQCNGGNDGVAQVFAQGGTPPYRYAFNGGTPGVDSLFVGITAGNYDIELIDDNNCRDTFPLIITEPAPLTGAANVQDITCAGEADGVITFVPSGGTSPYRYSLSGGPFVNDTSFTGLLAGNYALAIQDANNCVFNFSATIVEPDSLTVSISNTVNASCFGAADGQVLLSAFGGTAPYEFSTDLDTFTTLTTLSGLSSGVFPVFVRDANGCLAETEAIITEPEPLIGLIEPEDISCFGANDGMATTLLEGGTPNYSYIWSTGDTSANVSNLPPGEHVVNIRDANGCEIALSTEIIEPPRLFFDSTMTEDVTCFGGSDGLAFATATGGRPPLLYNWSNGVQDSVLREISAGEYIISVEDTNGCVIMDTLIVEEPPQIMIDIIDQRNPFCGLANGSLTVQASGGTPSYTYLWDTNPVQNGPTADNLLGGPTAPAYTVLVTDSLGCSNSLTLQLPLDGEPEAAFTTDFFPADSFLIDNDGVQFINQSTGASSYFWDFGDGGLSDEENPVHVYPEAGTYTVTLIAYDPRFLCPDTADLTFTLIPPGAIYVPNAFSPNNDGHNDFFLAKGVGVRTVVIDLYDRWGVHLKRLEGLEVGWNGTNKNGNPVQEGVYVYVVHAVLNDGREFDKVGTVTLFR